MPPIPWRRPVLQNVIIGAPGAGGVHRAGSRMCFDGDRASKEPTEIGSGADGTTCEFTPSDITYE
ncbi:hypothetical protein [Streptomyces turgidiscabies]|uniref:Uncharacterized protein n=1 Tax=Streptomyces turgidiscabies TaxID=85558 RepID=A0ABU0RJI3_9ACTN|nr:hypothetical protein [Streptomyces turgidiscabies]MDQ0931878.1 hypothetical protein [Streptomyces turgidiscabies]